MRLALLLLCAVLARAGEVRVDASCPWEDKDGYTPVLVEIEALIAPVDVTLEARMGGSRAGDAVRVEPGRPLRRTLLLPSNPGWGTPTLEWSSPGDGDTIAVGVGIDYRAAALAVLDPRERVPVPDLAKLIDAKAPDSGRSARGGYRSGRGDSVRRIAADGLPDRWQAWPAWLTLLTTPEGEALLDQPRREAIAAWCRAGGALFTTDPAAVAQWRRLGAEATVIAATAASQPELIERLRRVIDEDGRPTEYPVPGTEEVPTAWFLALAIAFAVVVGPLNIWWVMRRRRQPWMLLITTPLISAGTCLLLIAVALLSDGIGRRRAAAQVSLIDLEAQRAAVFSASTWFCGIAPGGFALDAEERLVPMDTADWNGGWRDRPSLALDWSAGQRALAGWIPARVNRQLASARQVPERRRIAIVADGAGWRAGNGLGVGIAELHWRDAAGMPWIARGLAPGQQVALERSPAGPPDLAGTLARCSLDARLALAGSATAPGWWIARLDAPLHALPGPEAEDVEPVEAWAAGRIAAAPGAAGGTF